MKRRLNLTKSQGNANENKMPFRLHETGKNQNLKVGKDVRQVLIHSCGSGRSWRATRESSWHWQRGRQACPAVQASTSALFPGDTSTWAQRHTGENVHCSATCDGTKLETTPVKLSGEMDNKWQYSCF